MRSELISIIVPVYNAERYLMKCIESIINQSYKNLEIILVNDGSTDKSKIICERYAEKDERIVIINQENSGQASARNVALSIAQGEYIGFVDADDWIEEEMYEVMLASMRNTNADIATCGRFVVNANTFEKSKVFCNEEINILDSKEAIRRFLLWEGIDGASCDKLFRKTVIDGLRYPTGYICEDLTFVYGAIKRSKNVCMTGIPFYNYLQTENSTSRSSYNKRSKGLAIYPIEIRDDVMSIYPELKEEAYAYYLKSIFALLKMYYEEKRMKPAPVQFRLNDFNNKYIDKNTKIKMFLMKVGLYRPILMMFRKLKR